MVVEALLPVEKMSSVTKEDYLPVLETITREKLPRSLDFTLHADKSIDKTKWMEAASHSGGPDPRRAACLRSAAWPTT